MLFSEETQVTALLEESELLFAHLTDDSSSSEDWEWAGVETDTLEIPESEEFPVELGNVVLVLPDELPGTGPSSKANKSD